MRAVTNSVCAISRLVRPWLASSATRRSLAVSDSRPLRTTRRGRAPVARSSVSACSASGAAPARCAASSASRSSSRAWLRRLRRRRSAPRSVSARARSSFGAALSERLDRLAEQRPRPRRRRRRRRPRAARRPSARGAPNARASSSSSSARRCAAGCVAEREVGERGLRSPGEIARAGDERARRQGADRQEVVEPVGDAALLDPQPAARETQDRGRERSDLGLGVERRERPLGLVELALVDERLDEHPGVQYAVHRRGGQLRRRQRRARVGLGGAEIAAPQREPAAMREADREPAAVAGRARLGDRGVEQRAHLRRTARPRSARPSPARTTSRTRTTVARPRRRARVAQHRAPQREPAPTSAGSFVRTEMNAATASSSGGAEGSRVGTLAQRLAARGHDGRRHRAVHAGADGRGLEQERELARDARRAPTARGRAPRRPRRSRCARLSASASTIDARGRAGLVRRRLDCRLQVRGPVGEAGARLGHAELEQQPRLLLGRRRLVEQRGAGRPQPTPARHSASRHARPRRAAPRPTRRRAGSLTSRCSATSSLAPGLLGEAAARRRGGPASARGSTAPSRSRCARSGGRTRAGGPARGCPPLRAARRPRQPRRRPDRRVARPAATRRARAPRAARASRPAGSGSRRSRRRSERPTVRAPIRSTCGADAASGAMPSSAEGVDERAHQERRAARRAQAGVDENRIRARCRSRLDEAARPPLASAGARRTISADGSVSDRREQVGVGPALARAARDDQRDVELLEPREQEREVAERRSVGPVRVVDDEAERALGREVGAQPVEAVQDRERRVDACSAALAGVRAAREVRAGRPRLRPRPAGSRLARAADASASTGSKSWRTTPKAKSRSSSAPRERSTRMSWPAATARAADRTAVLPMPAGPSTTRSAPVSGARIARAPTRSARVPRSARAAGSPAPQRLPSPPRVAGVRTRAKNLGGLPRCEPARACSRISTQGPPRIRDERRGSPCTCTRMRPITSMTTGRAGAAPSRCSSCSSSSASATPRRPPRRRCAPPESPARPASGRSPVSPRACSAVRRRPRSGSGRRPTHSQAGDA